ncbi:1,4-alpha-D-glucan glucanohydrolase OS=Streptomyces glaucescens OX=1907 GN=SGLAU_10125 PE=4 SV=1 [Streptomyces glaucescens]
MRRDGDTGVWSVTGSRAWTRKPYRYAVTVWAPSVRRIVTNKVTDPYSVALTADSARSLVVDLDDKALKPAGWSGLDKPEAVPLKDAQIQELHVRDHSVEDSTVPAGERGTYAAFSRKNSAGSRHLRALAEAGASHVHLLPGFDVATIPQKEADRATVECDLAASRPTPTSSRSAWRRRRRRTPTTGVTTRTTTRSPRAPTPPTRRHHPHGQFRKMVKALNEDGLRVVMDVVYNHTAASGQANTSVLDRIVPGYYQRLLADGSVANSTCSRTRPPRTP